MFRVCSLLVIFWLHSTLGMNTTSSALPSTALTPWYPEGMATVPPVARACWNCSSLDSPECLEALRDWKIEYCEGDLACAVWIEAGHTYRGCFKHWSNPHTFVCSMSFCNGFIYPESRKMCHQCSGPDCLQLKPNARPKPCPVFQENDLCYTVILNENSAYRGCQSDRTDGRNVCLKHSKLCMIGETNDQRPIRCVQCKFPNDQNCLNKTELSLCEYSVIEDLNRCVTITNGEYLVRDCLINHRVDCANYIFSPCTKCSNDGCNNQTHYELSCRKCSSEKDLECAVAEDEATATSCIATRGEDLACFHEDKGNNVSRGCWHTLSYPRRNECKANTDSCKICTSPMCNNKPRFQMCFVCDSRDDPSCAQLTTPLPRRTCPNYLDLCQAYVKDGITYRDCLSKEDAHECKGPECLSCEGILCNHMEVPRHRQKCHQCSDTDECKVDLRHSDKFLGYCRNYDPEDRCYVHMTSNGTVIRGCHSDEPAVCNNVNCKYCVEDGCNFRSVWAVPELSCIQCDDYACSWGFNKTFATKCSNSVYFEEEETCYTVKLRNGQVQRGCMVDDKHSFPINIEFYLTCQEMACNSLNVENRYCLQCRSDEDPECAEVNPKINPTKCLAEFVEFGKTECYWASEKGIIIRGCVADMMVDVKEVCTKDPKRCKFCNFNGCNGGDFAGKGSKVEASWGIVFLLLGFVFSRL